MFPHRVISGSPARRWFITAFITALVVAAGHIAIRMASGIDRRAAASAALAIWPWLFYFSSLFVWPSPRIAGRLWGTQTVTLIGGAAALLLGLWSGEYLLAVEALVVGMLGGSLYAWWYSRLPAPSAGLTRGMPLPSFALRDLAGQTVQSQELTQTPVLWVFYRGNWCPLCVAQIRELAEAYRQIEALGVRVILVSPQPEAQTQQLAQRFAVPFTFLVDPKNQAARGLELSHPGGLPLGMETLGYDSETVLPTVLLTRAGGEILAVHQTDNYLHRPEPEYFLALIGEHREGWSV